MTATLARAVYNDFRPGVDLREGTFLEGEGPAVRLKAGENVIINNNRRLSMRWPIVELDATLSDDHQGAFDLNQRTACFKRKGAAGVITGPDAGQIDVLEFDVPPGCGDDWELVDVIVINSITCAYIRHAFAGGNITTPEAKTVDNICWLHVWDDLQADGTYYTWTSDPYMPTNWVNGLYLGNGSTTDDSDNPYVRDYRPRLAVVGSRLAVSTADGNVALSKVGEFRVWNDLTQADIEQFGEIFTWVMPLASDPPWTNNEVRFSLPLMFVDLVWDKTSTGGGVYARNETAGHDGYRFWSYTLQVWDSDQAQWLSILEQPGNTAPGTDDQFRVTPSVLDVNRVDIVYTDNTQTRYHNRIFRFKAIRKKHQQWPDGIVLHGGTGGQSRLTNPTADQVEYWNDRDAEWPPHMNVNPPNDSVFYIGYYDIGFIEDLPLETGGGDTAKCRPFPNGAADGSGTVYFVPGDSGKIVATDPAPGVHFITGTERYLGLCDPILMQNQGGNTIQTPAGLPAFPRDGLWHNKRFDLEIRLAGSLSSLVIGTATYDSGGGQPTGLIGTRDGLLVQYETSTSWWAVGADPDNVAFIGRSPFGSGTQDGWNRPVEIESNLVFTRTVRTFFAWSITGDQGRSLADNNVGEPIEGYLDNRELMGSAYWPHQGYFVSMTTDDQGTTTAAAFKYSKQSSIAAWSTFTFGRDERPTWRTATATASFGFFEDHGELYHIGSRLYFRHEDKIRYFDAEAEAPNYQDAGDPDPWQIQATMTFHRLRLHPNRMKKLHWINFDARGTLTFTYRISLRDEDEVLPGITVGDITYDDRKLRFPSTQFYSIQIDLGCSDPNGFQLNEFEMLYNTQRRWRT